MSATAPWPVEARTGSLTVEIPGVERYDFGIPQARAQARALERKADEAEALEAMAAVRDLAAIVGEASGASLIFGERYEIIARAVYDAGYRKTGGAA